MAARMHKISVMNLTAVTKETRYISCITSLYEAVVTLFALFWCC